MQFLRMFLNVSGLEWWEPHGWSLLLVFGSETLVGLKTEEWSVNVYLCLLL